MQAKKKKKKKEKDQHTERHKKGFRIRLLRVAWNKESLEVVDGMLVPHQSK